MLIDVVKPEPKTELEYHRRWVNYTHSVLSQLNRNSKKIKVKHES